MVIFSTKTVRLPERNHSQWGYNLPCAVSFNMKVPGKVRVEALSVHGCWDSQNQKWKARMLETRGIPTMTKDYGKLLGFHGSEFIP